MTSSQGNKGVYSKLNKLSQDGKYHQINVIHVIYDLFIL